MTPAKDHIETELLLRYVEGKTDKVETRMVELHVAECALCDEALDGLLVAKDMDMVRADLARVEGEITGKYAKTPVKGKINIWRWLAAASVLCVLGLGLYQLTPGKQEDKEIAQVEEAKTTTEANTEQPLAPALTDTQLLADSPEPLKEKSSRSGDKTLSPTLPPSENKSAEIVAMQEEGVQPTKSLTQTTIPSRSTTASPAAPKPYVSADAIKDNGEIVADAVGTSKKDSKALPQNTVPATPSAPVASKPVPNDYDDVKYLAAESLNDSKIEQEDLAVLEKKAKPAKISANYTQAQKLFRQKNYSEAALLLEQILPGAANYAEAQSLLEKCYRKLGNVAAADEIQRSLNANKPGKNVTNTQAKPTKTDKK